jgi:hypothetical protein
MDSWVVVPCQRSRLDMLKRLLDSLQHPKHHVVIVATQPEPLGFADIGSHSDHIVLCHRTEHYISTWWNLGLSYARHMAIEPRYEVLVLSSDNVGRPDSIAMLATFMRERNLTMVGPNPWTNHIRIFKLHDVRGCHDRVPGGCWMLAGESGLRVDEEFRWWYSDDDLEMQARAHGGAGILPGTGLVGGPDSPLDVERQLWAFQDREKFVAKWGKQPW